VDFKRAATLSPAELAIVPKDPSSGGQSRASVASPMIRPRVSLKGYTDAVMATGALLLAVAVPTIVQTNPAWLLGLVFLAVATSLFKLSLQVSGGGATMTFGHAVGFFGLLAVGPHPTALAVMAGIWAQCSYRLDHETPMDLRRRLFSMASGVITVESAGWIFEAAGGVPGGPASAALAAPLAAAALTYFFVNTGLVAGAVTLDNGETFSSVWYNNFLWSAPSYFISAALVGCAAVVVERSGPVAALLFATPLVLTFLSYRAYLGRIASEREHLRHANQTKGIDALTGLPNRLLLLELIERALEQHRLNPRRQYAVLFLDLDGFKLVNDSLGHQAGDRLLQATAGRLEAVLNPTEQSLGGGQSVRQLNGTAARLGGDEFVVLLDDVDGTDDATRVAQRLQDALALPFDLDGRPVYVTASVGISLGSSTYGTPEEILRDADTAMYRAKSAGKAKSEVFDASMREGVLARLQLETEVRSGVEREEFMPYYQPIIDLETGGLAGFEALIRWRHPERGVLAPAEFMSVMEDTGVVTGAGQRLFGEVCRQIAAWDEWPGARDLSVNVNFAGQQFHNPNLVDELLAMTAEAGIAPGRITIEITESAAINNFPRAVNVLRQARDAGFRIVLDDFGTGYSSLSCLHELPISGIKLDRSFLTSRKRHPMVLEALATLAGQLGLTVTAEGVELASQCAELKNIGCDLAQGYLFARPVAASEATEYLRVPSWLPESTERPKVRHASFGGRT
jgi:diguanylate cyclase (GGDEF)-like protein